MSDELDPERALLGLVLARPRTLTDIEDVDAGDFAQPKHAGLWTLMRWMDSQGIAPEPVAVTHHLPRIELPGLNGLWVHALFADAPVSVPAHVYATMVRERAALRRLATAGRRIVQLAEGGGNAHEIQELGRQEIDAASRAVATTRWLADTIDGTLDSFEAPARAVTTPWPDLDAIIKGWRPGALYVVGARPGIGKTIVGVQAAIGLAAHGPVAFTSLEMPEAELHQRIIAHQAAVSISRMDARTLTDADWTKIANHRSSLGALPIAIDDRGTVTVTDVRSHARSVSRREPLAGIVVDYMQLMSSPRGDRRPRHEVVADYSRQLKLLAKEFDCPVIALSQLNRASESRQDKRPSLADLRESGAVEQDSDVVLLLHEHEEDETRIDMLVAKNRHGPRGSVELTRRGWFSRMDPREWSPTRNVTPEAS